MSGGDALMPRAEESKDGREMGTGSDELQLVDELAVVPSLPC